MATKKIQIIPPGYADLLYPETSADSVKLTDTAGVFIATEVETALKELYDRTVSTPASLDSLAQILAMGGLPYI